MPGRYPAVLLAAALSLCLAAPAFAVAYDTPTVTLNDVGSGKFTLTVTAGPSGLPDGFSMYWMTALDYEDYGSVWPSTLTYPGLHWANFTGAPTLNTFDTYTTFVLGPNESIEVELGDLEDETGVSTNSSEEMTEAENYVVCAFANGGAGGTRSGYSLNAVGTTIDKKDNCIHSQGYWKTHGSAWPVSSLTLGTVSYTKTQLLSILNKSANGNGLISLAKQLIAAKLNVINGAIPPSFISTTISAADAQIGALVVPPVGSGFLAPSSTSSKTQKLDDFNNNKYHGGCGSTAAVTSTWGRLKTLYR